MNKKLKTILTGMIPVLLIVGFVIYNQQKSGTQGDAPPAPSPSPPANTPAAADDSNTVRPLLGALTIRVPEGIIGDDYWVYVNKHIVRAPSQDSTSDAASDFIRVATPNGMKFYDKSGLAAESEQGQFTYLRDGISDTLFQEVVIKLAPGNYVVEMMCKNDQGPEFPFYVTKAQSDVQLNAGDSQTVAFGLPLGWTDSASAAGAAAVAASGPVTAEEATQLQKNFQDWNHRYEQDPLVQALSNVQRNFAFTPPLGPTVYVDLPENVGGPRELDADQIDATIKKIVSSYEFSLDATDRGRWQAAGSNFVQFYDQFSGQVDAYNKMVEGLHSIVDKLQQAQQK